jgi:ABC-type polysaccharide/polyol phosphate transport system ATPase subunit
MEFAVSARDVGKVYRLYERPLDRLVEAVTRRPRHREFRALEGVSFDLPRGLGLGLIGENGAGKSTLLKIVAGTTTPTEGAVWTSGAVASILELGMGFHHEFTGRDNARINAALLGLSASEVRRCLPEIRDFSELGDFFDQPVKTYSSGMAMRLAFSVATHVDADVVIIDEALAVGDGYFQKKSIDRILEYKKRGGTLLFCSHALYYVATICDEAIWLHQGLPREKGPSLSVIRAYEAYLLRKERPAEPAPAAPSVSREAPAKITDLVIHDGSGFSRSEFATGDTVAFDVAFETADPSLEFTVRIGVDREDGVQVFGADTAGWERAPLSGRRSYRVRLTLPQFPVTYGNFKVVAFLADEHALYPHDMKVLSPAFTVRSPNYVVGLVRAPYAWSLLESDSAATRLETATPRGLAV